MSATRLLWMFALAFAAPAALSQEDDYDSAKLRRLFMRNMHQLCEWIPGHAPPGNPTVIHLCLPDHEPLEVEQIEMNQAGSESDTWWAWWRENDEPTFDRLRKEWDAELKTLYAKDEAERKAEAQKKAKADRAQVVAALPTMKVPELCRVVRRGKTPEAVEELAKRKAYPANEVSLIAGRKVTLGMSEGAMLCALGEPERANRSVGSWGTHIQYVYNGLIVYVENGKVTSWQD